MKSAKRVIVRRLGLLIVAGFVTAMLVYSFWPQSVAVEVAEVVRGPLTVTVDEDGRTRIRERYVVSAPLNGHMSRISLRPGDEVEKGVTLLTTIQPLRPHLLDVRELAQAEARVKAAEAAVKRSQNTLNAAQATLEFAAAELERARAVARERIISRSELDNAEMMFRMRTEEYAAARYAEDIARFELELARAALAQARPLEDTTAEELMLHIYSPIDGEVLRVITESAQVVTAGKPLLEVGDPTDLEVEIDVLSGDAVRIVPGAKVWLDHWGGDQPLEGRVRLVEPSGYTKISALGVEEQRVNVIVDLITPAHQRETLRDGFRVEAQIVVWEASDILRVPVSSMFRFRQSWAVFVLAGLRVEIREIRIGQRSSSHAQVLSGLTAGDHVVVHPSDRLSDGTRVMLQTR